MDVHCETKRKENKTKQKNLQEGENISQQPLLIPKRKVSR